MCTQYGQSNNLSTSSAILHYTSNQQMSKPTPKPSWNFSCIKMCLPQEEHLPTRHSSTLTHPHYATSIHVDEAQALKVNSRIKAHKLLSQALKNSSINIQLNQSASYFCFAYSTQSRFSSSTPDHQEAFSRYLAQRCHTTGLILEVNAGNGQFTTQFQRENNMVIALESQTPELVKAAISTYKCEERVELIQAKNISSLKHLKVDILFINLTKTYGKAQLEESIYSASFATKNLVILMNSLDDTSQVVEYLSHCKKSQYLSYEQETIQINNQIVYKVLYFGDVARFTSDDELCALTYNLLLERKRKNFSESLYHILRTAKKRIGKRQLIEYICQTIRNLEQGKSILKKLLDLFNENGVVAQTEVEQIIKNPPDNQSKHEAFKKKYLCKSSYCESQIFSQSWMRPLDSFSSEGYQGRTFYYDNEVSTASKSEI